ncbi:uncharacterized protein LOC130891191 isoform X1 [Diorhabda carinulata]|uniref:uncharacterized protein LOC130891191 isoform X1 n=1 Tax=Diorhabda carinulata TaxID=1163345 RepID=UPI0025A032ED|nr:uncharacterized protein LOC130891191 isoform X1 [Diorhabda carinulata]
MINVMYWSICILCVVGGYRSLVLDEEDMSNDYPFNAPQYHTKTLRVKNGTPLRLKCHQDKAKWYFKPCDSNFYGIVCNEKNRHWRRLENVTRGRIHFEAANKEHNGIYRCSQNNVPVKIFIVDVFDPGYSGSPPQVYPLKISNITGPINMEFTIQCKVNSEVPPTIIWFKSCYGQKCDFKYYQTCYCHINTSISNYNTGSTYLSKYLIFNARDVDSGTYVCLAVTQFGKDDQNVTISVPYTKSDNDFYSLLFLIPFGFLLVPLLVWWCYFRKKKKSVVIVVDQQKQLIRAQCQPNLG